MSAITFQGNFVKTNVVSPIIKMANESEGERRERQKITFRNKKKFIASIFATLQRV
jgi:hypothetical protein